MPKGVGREYLLRLQERYLKASKRKKSLILRIDSWKMIPKGQLTQGEGTGPPVKSWSDHTLKLFCWKHF